MEILVISGFLGAGKTTFIKTMANRTGREFASTVLTIANTVEPDYLVIEPTGAAMLGQVIQNLK